MNTYSNSFYENEIRTRQMIYEKYRTLFRETEALEKEAIKKLGENDPIAEELSTVWIHMMNGDISIEKYLQSNVPGRSQAALNTLKTKEGLYLGAAGCNQLEFKTLKQLFQVLESIKWSGAQNRAEIRSACSSAAKLTAKSYGIERNTVADIWVTRLGLEKKTAGFIDLVEGWLNGDASGLKRVLKCHTYNSLHGLIDAFFKKKGTLH
jgi:hypothetical protein